MKNEERQEFHGVAIFYVEDIGRDRNEEKIVEEFSFCSLRMHSLPPLPLSSIFLINEIKRLVTLNPFLS